MVSRLACGFARRFIRRLRANQPFQICNFPPHDFRQRALRQSRRTPYRVGNRRFQLIDASPSIGLHFDYGNAESLGQLPNGDFHAALLRDVDHVQRDHGWQAKLENLADKI